MEKNLELLQTDLNLLNNKDNVVMSWRQNNGQPDKSPIEY